LEVSERVLRKRIKERNKGNAKNYFKSFNRWKKEFREFGRKIKSDVILGNERGLDLKAIFKKLDKLLI